MLIIRTFNEFNALSNHDSKVSYCTSEKHVLEVLGKPGTVDHYRPDLLVGGDYGTMIQELYHHLK